MQRIISMLTFLYVFICLSIGQTSNLVPFRLKNVWGYSDKTGLIKIKPVYHDVTVFNLGFAAVKIDNKWGIINEHGSIIVEPTFDSVCYYFQNGYNHGFIHSSFSMPSLEVVKNGKTCFVDTLGKVFQLNDDALVIDGGSNKSNFSITEEGLYYNSRMYKILNPNQYDTIIPTSIPFYKLYKRSSRKELRILEQEIGFIISKDQKFGVLNKNDSIIIKCKYSFIEKNFTQGFFWVKDEKGYIHTIDENENIIIPPIYTFINLKTHNMTHLVKKDGQYGLIENNNRILIPFQASSIFALEEGRSYMIKKKDSIFTYNGDGEIFLKGKFDTLIYNLYPSGFFVESNNKWGFYDSGGKNIIPILYDKIEVRNSYFIVSLKSKQGVFNSNGQTLPLGEYKVDKIFDGLYKIKLKNGKSTYINDEGFMYCKD